MTIPLYNNNVYLVFCQFDPLDEDAGLSPVSEEEHDLVIMVGGVVLPEVTGQGLGQGSHQVAGVMGECVHDDLVVHQKTGALLSQVDLVTEVRILQGEGQRNHRLSHTFRTYEDKIKTFY